MTDASETKISLSLPDGRMTPAVPLSVAKAALEEVQGRPVARKASAQSEAFSEKETGEETVHGIARAQLRAFVERIERLEEEKQTIAEDIKDVYGEAKSMGYDTKVLRKVISLRKMDGDERLEQEAILDTYLAALGMLPADGE